MQRALEEQVLVVAFQNGRTNSITYDELMQLNGFIDEVNRIEEIKGLILTGTGTFYSSGFDLPAFMGFRTVDEAKAFFQFAEEVFLNLFSCTKPVIAAISGHCVAGGMMTAMATDYRIGVNNPKIKLGMSEIKIGLAMMPTQAEIMRFGLDTNQRFRDVMFFGKMYEPMEAHRMGLIDEIVDPDSLLPRAKALVAEWIDTPGRPFIELKRTQRKHAIRQMIAETAAYNWEAMLQPLLSDEVKQTLAAVQKGMER